MARWRRILSTRFDFGGGDVGTWDVETMGRADVGIRPYNVGD
ncbi:MAG: hypothetical protein RSA20_07960 [Oscillospiraceae bacterium]